MQQARLPKRFVVLLPPANCLNKLLPHHLTSHLVKGLAVRGLSKESQWNLKPSFVFDVSTAVIDMAFFIETKSFFQEAIGVDAVTPGADGTVDAFAVNDAEYQNRVGPFAPQEELGGLGDAIPMLPAHEADVGEDEIVEDLFAPESLFDHVHHRRRDRLGGNLFEQ